MKRSMENIHTDAGCEGLKKMFRRESCKNMSWKDYHKLKTYFDFFESKNIDYS